MKITWFNIYGWPHTIIGVTDGRSRTSISAVRAADVYSASQAIAANNGDVRPKISRITRGDRKLTSKNF